jgi:membrane protease YdiL (CAAX protease family)
MFLRGGLGEEVGLRAFAVPKLMKRLSPMKSSFVIGVIWALWHYIVWWEQGAVNLIVLSVVVIAWSMVYTFVYIKTGSIWTMILLHAVGNAFDDVLEWLYPNLAHVDWEIPYILCVITWGVISLVLLLRMKRNLNLDAKPKV